MPSPDQQACSRGMVPDGMIRPSRRPHHILTAGVGASISCHNEPCSLWVRRFGSPGRNDCRPSKWTIALMTVVRSSPKDHITSTRSRKSLHALRHSKSGRDRSLGWPTLVHFWAGAMRVQMVGRMTRTACFCMQVYDTTTGVIHGCPPQCFSSMAHAACSGHLSQFLPAWFPKNYELLTSMIDMLRDARLSGQSLRNKQRMYCRVN
ncbi:hypothetical protein IAQ61_003347 [Plenodomus lingam]|uniref:uncharacterized protein n=1 Tax=Leptosphaeria maculans TaxID=5022 RepID=UPI003331D557|nr:hypothetical protein IAQ61_003347 [Plenodomus lingam]